MDGSYYSGTLSQEPDEEGGTKSQGYLTSVNTRALIFIEAENCEIGLMCFVAVGMAEISSCDITIHEGQHVTKGQQLGMFRFGGSTYCLVFQPGVELEFDFHGETPGLDAKSLPVNSKLATVIVD